MPEDWVKLDPIQLGSWLAPWRTSRERGEWVVGLQAGALGALLRLGATPAEEAGHAAGAALLEAKRADKRAASELQRARAQVRWNKRATAEVEPDAGDMPRHVSGTIPAMPREEKRGEESSPQEGRTARGRATPSHQIPEWKANRLRGLRGDLDLKRQDLARCERRVAAGTMDQDDLTKAQRAVQDAENKIRFEGESP